MRFRTCQFVLLISALTIVGCKRTQDTTNQFITDFLSEHSVQVYKSEMQRTRVNYIPRTKLLVYSFWKKEMFDKNGDLFLHIYAKDTALLPEARKKHGFINLSIKKEDIMVMDSLNFYITKDLSSFGELDSFVTGQYIGSKRTWFAKHRINSISSNDTSIYHNAKLDSIKNMLKIGKKDADSFAAPAYRMTFLNYLLASGSKLVFREENAFNVFWNQDSSQVYITYNIDADFLKYEYSLNFFEGKEDPSALLETVSLTDPSLNLKPGSNKVLAICIKVPEQTKRMAMLRLETDRPKMVFNAKFD
ncbi:hypothetical protein ACFQZJ_00170 [Maribacter chungangensis]|uniref:DUF4292 domain-containing protein n=1 Tax=Maribacter chungangensis TaxID=1069117 RepID=A0ABW3AXR2_9FLAO